MAYKQLGPGVSQNPQAVVSGGGAYTAEDHSWESLVFQFNKPVVDWELNLQNEICGPYGLAQHARQTLASGFLYGDFYESGSIGSSFSFLTPSVGNENAFIMAAADLVVNGWPIRFEFSGTSTSGQNSIELPVPPAFGTDANVVILEVWRALVTAGTTDNKSLSGQILRHGNAKAPDTVGNRNLADDLTDPAILEETQARIQIQYRYRVVPFWGLGTYPEVPDQVVANTVPYLSGSDVDGAASIYAYARVDGDPGLWRAGSGDATSATNLGTADGHIYAVPLCAVFRRNSDPFDKDSNINGGALTVSGTSDRPDGLFSDQVIAADVLDLRKGVAADFQEALSRNLGYLLKGELATEYETTIDTCSGTSVFVRDKLGSPGNRRPDGVRLHYSDRATIETLTCAVSLADTSPTPHASVTVDLTALPTPWGVADITALAPAGVEILDISSMRVQFPAAGTEEDAFDIYNTSAHVTGISLAGTVATIYLDDLTLGQDLDFFIELAIGYPKGCGLSKLPLNEFSMWAPTAACAWIDPSLVTVLSDVSRLQLDSTLWSVDESHRELRLAVKGVDVVGEILLVPHDSLTGLEVWLPQRLDGSPITIDDGSNPPYVTTNYTVDAAYTQINLSFARPIDTTVLVTYAPIRPAMPAPFGTTYELFYQAKANQSVVVTSGVQTMQLRLRAAPQYMIAATAGTASPDDMDWLSTGFFQLPLADGYPDWEVDSSVATQLENSDAVASGYAQVPVKLAYMSNGEVTILNNGDLTKDAEERNFWPRVTSDVIFCGAPNLASDVIHRAAYPMLMEVVATTTDLVRPGTLVLAVFTAVSTTAQPVVNVSTTTGLGCVALFRTRGNLMNPRRLIP